MALVDEESRNAQASTAMHGGFMWDAVAAALRLRLREDPLVAARGTPQRRKAVDCRRRWDHALKKAHATPKDRLSGEQKQWLLQFQQQQQLLAAGSGGGGGGGSNGGGNAAALPSRPRRTKIEPIPEEADEPPTPPSASHTSSAAFAHAQAKGERLGGSHDRSREKSDKQHELKRPMHSKDHRVGFREEI
jgi:hypothetical protein